jgi:hypothetical protein
MDIGSFQHLSQLDLEQSYQVAVNDYASLVVLALKDLGRAGYRLSPIEQDIADGFSTDFRQVLPHTWAKIPLDTRQEIAKARSYRESIRARMNRLEN